MQKLSLVISFLLISGCSPKEDPSTVIESLTFKNPMVIEAREGTTTGAFFALTNNGPEADYLEMVSSPAARMTQIHITQMQGDVMTMKEIPGIELPSNQTVEFHRGGLHIMLMDLKTPLVPGNTLEMIFKFRSAGEVIRNFPIVAR